MGIGPLDLANRTIWPPLNNLEDQRNDLLGTIRVEIHPNVNFSWKVSFSLRSKEADGRFFGDQVRVRIIVV